MTGGSTSSVLFSNLLEYWDGIYTTPTILHAVTVCMVQPDLPFAISVLVPVIFLLVINISDKVQRIDLFKTLDRSNNNFSTGFDRIIGKQIRRLPGFEDSQQILQFGHFGTLHGISLTLLIYGAILVGYGTNNSVEFVLTFSVWVMISILPLLEIEEYNTIDINSKIPKSVKANSLGSLIPVIFASSLGDTLASGYSIPSLFFIILSGILFVMIPMAISLSYFSLYLQKELESADRN